jgi:hypothetical protein
MGLPAIAASEPEVVVTTSRLSLAYLGAYERFM